MGLDGIKQGVFRHFEKVILVVVVAFVLMNVMGHMSDDGGSGPPIRPPGGSRDLPAQDVPCGFLATVGSYLDFPTISRPPYDIWWPPSIRYVGIFTLKRDTDQATKTIKVSEEDKITSRRASKIDIPDDKRKGLNDHKRNVDSVVDITISESGAEIILTGTKEGRFVAYEVQLESGDKLRFFVIVHPPEQVDTFVVQPPEDVKVGEKEFGVVVVDFKPPAPREPETKGNVTITYAVPTQYNIYRQGPEDKEGVLYGRIEAGGKASIERRPPRRGVPAPAGLPGGGPPPPGGAPGGAPDGDEAAVGGAEGGRLRFIDRSVDSEASYTYVVYGVAKNPEEKLQDSLKVTLGVTTKARFTFLSTGGRPGYANIIVIIGPRDDHEGYKTFAAPIGGRVGELPHVRQPGAALDAEAPDQRYVTGYVLVDIVPNAFKLMRQKRTEFTKHPVHGRPVPKVIEIPYGMYGRYVILRDAKKNRLIRIWVERRPRDLPSEAEEK
ncbi:hypothetical protein HQ560_12080 [bacterium]|nr:hypothetical protein [bacterium]